MIYAKNQRFYDWKYEQTPENVNITFELPPGLKTSDIKIDFQENISILVTIPQQPPVLCGQFSGKVDSFEIETNDSQFVLKFKKSHPEMWNLIISSKHPIRNTIDPRSSVLLFQFHESGEKKSREYKLSLAYLNQAVTQGFLPAIKKMSDVFMENEALRGPGMDLLKHGADTYEDPEFCKEFGKMAALVDNNAEKGLEYLEKGAKKGCKECNVVIGKVLSPCSDIKCRRKNAEKALKNLEEAMDDPESQHEMAKIYMNGAEGIEKDLKKAKILQKQARKQSSNIPSLPEIEGSETLPFIIGASIVAGIGVTAFALYKLLRRNKK